MTLYKEDDKCLICNSTNIKKYTAKSSDFITERVFEGKVKFVHLLYCKDCGFSYFTYRFNDNEVKKLYVGYRNSNYQKQRQHHESWYTKNINDLIGKNKKEIISRNENFTKILKENLDIAKINSILDFGGDEGQFIPKIFKNINKYVYDISNVKTLDNITPLKTQTELKNHNYDLVMCAHVLEHVVNPIETINDIKSIMKKGTYLYIELPYDSPFCKNPLSNIQFLFNPHYSFINIVKQFIKLKTNKGYLMNEHINYYTLESVKKLMQNAGFKVIYNEFNNIKSEIGNSKVISTLCIL